MNFQQRKTNSLSIIYKQTILLFIFFVFSLNTYSQYKIRYDNDYLTTLTFGPEEKDGFRVSVSLVALFTAGAADRNGFRWGAGVAVSQTVDNWTFSAGLDTYKAKQKYGIGSSFAGVLFDDGYYGTSYYLNKYFQGEKQLSGIVNVHLDDFLIRFEDDILSFPFVGFKVYDRYRSAALEIRYRGFMVGTNVFTSDSNGLTDASTNNNKGTSIAGKQISSPVYIGYTSHDLLLRYGINNRTGGFIGQNFWHQQLFHSPDFKYGEYSNQFLQVGVDKPYTLY